MTAWTVARISWGAPLIWRAKTRPFQPPRADPLDRRGGQAGPFLDRRIIQVGVQVLVFLDEHKERLRGHLFHQALFFLGGDPGGRFENRAKDRLVRRVAGLLAQPVRAVGRTGEGAHDVLRDLQGDQARILVFVNIEDDRRGGGVQDVAGGQVPVGLEHHLERKGDVQQADLAAGIEGIHPGRFGGAGLQQRARGRVLDPAGGVVADLLDRVVQGGGAEGEEIGRDDVFGAGGRRGFRHALGDHAAELHFAGVKIEPKRFQSFRIQGFHGLLSFPNV